jgi:hypothetical protein
VALEGEIWSFLKERRGIFLIQGINLLVVWDEVFGENKWVFLFFLFFFSFVI